MTENRFGDGFLRRRFPEAKVLSCCFQNPIIYIGQKGQSWLKLHLELVEYKRLTFDVVILMKLIEE